MDALLKNARTKTPTYDSPDRHHPLAQLQQGGAAGRNKLSFGSMLQSPGSPQN